MRNNLNYGGAGTKSLPAGSLLYALLCTGVIFLLLPLSEALETPARGTTEIRAVDAINLVQAPPEIRRLAPPSPPVEKERPEVPRMELNLEMPEQPAGKAKGLDLPVTFRVASPDFRGDFDLNFSVTPGALIAPARPDIYAGVFEISEVDNPPRPLLRGKPIYPFRALRRNIEGHVMLEMTVTRDGRVEDVHVLESMPGDVFEEAAKKAAANWRFEPAVKDGQPVAVRVETMLYFQMED
jgi:protein TonB